MSSQTSILLYGRDPHLLETRQWVLERAGYRVLTVTRLSEIANLPSPGQIDLSLLCHTLSLEECGRAFARTHLRWPQIETIFLMAGQKGCQRGPADKVVDAMEGPGKLLNVVAKVVSSETALPPTSQKSL